MNILFFIFLASLFISLCVWIALLFFYFKKETLNKITFFLVSLSAGALTGGAFLHLLPEAAEKMDGDRLYFILLFSFSFFFFLEKVFRWRHCHKDNCPIHTFGYINLFGDSIHNFIDGLVIAGAFITDIKLGIITTLAIALHEIPQEIGDFAVLLLAGFNRTKALLLNYLVALTVVLGAFVGYFLSAYLENIILNLLPFAAGGFIYIAASDLMPEIRKETEFKKSAVSFLFFLFGIFLMFLLKFVK